MKTIVFTGAGAAKADGAPLQTELFHEFFSRAAVPASRHGLAREVEQFFQRVFSVDPRSTTALLPTFEEALGVLELAISREEGILGIGEREALGDLRHIRRQLILALAATIARSNSEPGIVHGRLIASLRDCALLDSVTFVTTNYDTLLDDAIEAQAIGGGRGTGSVVEYGLASLVDADSDQYAEQRRFPCYKLHGSLNWLLCSACDILDITYASSGVTRLLDDPDAARCPSCETLRTPVIIAPSYYKDISNIHLAVVWNRASRALQEADQIVFCGYSFPDADMHVKYLVKRAQLNREVATRPLRAVLINNYVGKSPTVAAEELARFHRFLGAAHVRDSGISFQDFAQDPGSLLRFEE
jgi:NAD-dependent SIR2 family protein deacetylase